MLENQLLRQGEVLARVALSRPTVWRLRRRGMFPLPIDTGAGLRWRADEVEAWI